MCGCFVLLLGAFAPRLALALMALFNDEITRAFDGSWITPLVGWFLLPYTTLAYVLLSWWGNGVSGFDWFLVALAFVVDLGSYTGGYARRSDIRYPSAGAR
ncbi:MAG: hypothetical protein WCF36_07435 [Candidatus Nanopelagicales bacterium]